MTPVGSGRPRISVVVNTLNRAEMLDRTLESFQWLKYRDGFEVIVVNGPSSDATPDVLAKYAGRIRVGGTEEANLSVSRNTGIKMALGDIVAFIDDDAIPEPEWLDELAAVYADPFVGAAGGFVFDHTGYNYQYRFATADRLGNANLDQYSPQPQLAFPGSFNFPHLLGANSSFRRTALVKIGGFDEEFEYYLDETDVQLRIVDAGFVVAQVPSAVVHHHFAPSSLRGTNRVARRRLSVLKNKLYFSLKHARDYMSMEAIIAEQNRFIVAQREQVVWAVSEGLLSDQDLAQFELDVDLSTEIGMRRGLEGPKAPTVDVTVSASHRFVPFPTHRHKKRRRIALVSQEYAPENVGGIGTFTRDTAGGLAKMGHDVHVVTRSADVNRVDYENGVWVHRILPTEHPLPANVDVPTHIWSWSKSAVAEVARVSSSTPIDVVEAPIWDAQGIAFLVEGRWPLVTSLQTTLKTWLDTHTSYRDDPAWMASFGLPMQAAEKKLMEKSDAVRAISRAIQDDLSRLYGVDLSDGRSIVAHLGVSDPGPVRHKGVGRVSAQPGMVSLLFVGRLEARKGVDTLLEAFESALAATPNLLLNLVGDDTLPIDAGSPDTYRTKFQTKHRGNPEILNAVRFVGQVSDHQLDIAYENSDIFVAPSRYESFGLVFVEAFSHGLPVIGTRVGGVPEIVTSGVEGILVPPSDAQALSTAIVSLSRDKKLLAGMAKAGRRRFSRDFTVRAMATRSEPIFELAISRFESDRTL